MLYNAYQAQSDTLQPLRVAARCTARSLGDGRMPFATGGTTGSLRRLSAACEVFAAAQITHRRPAFGIESVRVGEDVVPIVEEVALVTPFATLLHFGKPALAELDLPPQPKVLIAAPMSGHFATLLRDTVRDMLADHDVYITDWHNARDVPLAAGRFGLDEYTEHLIRFLAAIGEGVQSDGDLPALRGVARRRGADVGRRPSGGAAQPDADGRSDRLPHQPDHRQRAGHRQADRMVREESHQPRAVAACRRAAAACIRASCSSAPS